MTDTQRINIVLPKTQIKMLRHIAKRNKRSFSSVLRQAIEEYTGVPDTVQLGGDFGKPQK